MGGSSMVTKKLMILLAAAILSLGVVSTSFAAQEEIKGLVTEIEVDKITVMNDRGQTITVMVEDPRSLRDLRVGDKVVVRDGKVTKVPSG
jgi:hypothetical protein